MANTPTTTKATVPAPVNVGKDTTSQAQAAPLFSIREEVIVTVDSIATIKNAKGVVMEVQISPHGGENTYRVQLYKPSIQRYFLESELKKAS